MPPLEQVADVETAKVRGLQGLEYLDRVSAAPPSAARWQRRQRQWRARHDVMSCVAAGARTRLGE